MKTIHIVFLTIFIVCLSPGQADTTDISGEEWLATTSSFYDVVKHRNEMAIKGKTKPFLLKLDKCEELIDNAPAGSPLSLQLNTGETLEKSIVAAVTGLMDYRRKHNSRLKKWSSEDSQYASFLEPLHVTAGKIRSIKDTLFPRKTWRHVAVHWYPYGVTSGLHKDLIPAFALELVPDQWHKGEPALQEYAFFSFLRKACKPNVFSQDFIDTETGYDGFWHTEGMDFDFSQWQSPAYYSYRYIPRSKVPVAKGQALRTYVENVCLPSLQDGNLQSRYEQKLRFFRTVIREAGRPESINVNASPYMDLFAFTARTIPVISAFRMGVGQDGTSLVWVEGFAGDSPAKQKFNREESPVGMAISLAERLSDRTILEFLSPIFLLQSRLPVKDESESINNFPYEVSKVGFKGYRDFYWRKTRSMESE